MQVHNIEELSSTLNTGNQMLVCEPLSICIHTYLSEKHHCTLKKNKKKKKKKTGQPHRYPIAREEAGT
jgi:hypothetical protein